MENFYWQTENFYSPLESEECDFDVFQPETTPELPEAVVIVPHLHKKERPKKKGPGSSLADRDRDEAVLEEALLQSHEALLMIKPDHVKANIKHYHASETLFHESKNMDQIVQAIRSCPLSWSMVFLQKLKHGGDALLDLGTLHLWDRVLASESMDDDNNIYSFYQRINDLNLPIGNTRAEYVKFLKLTFRQLSSEDKNAWNLLRYLSLLELLTLSFCPVIFQHHAWLQYIVENTDEGLPHKHVKLLSDKSLLMLLRSKFGQQLLSTASQIAPKSPILIGLEALRKSNLVATSLPTLSSTLLTEPFQVSAMEVDN
ncbi:unnamed protein product [Phytophthora lilii]|uniref:Unnamed protein product n=1 Tax=Phytophthora lilii TaxID=2077276 RepID=A0A9W6X5U7_9STRA|nr:unnamed protein product [Phytophthora lilii]